MSKKKPEFLTTGRLTLSMGSGTYAERAKDEKTYGSLSGVANMLGELDSWGTIIAPWGIPDDVLRDFEANGAFCAFHKHRDAGIGYIESATIQGRELQVELAYHSTEEAQECRTVAQERMAAGKSVGLSLGFEIASWVYFPTGASLIEHLRQTRANLNLFNVPQIEACEDEVYLLTLSKILEVSQVNFPANEPSKATEVRDAGDPDNNEFRGGGSRAGLTLSEELDAALATVTAITARVEEIRAIRHSEGRELSAARVESLKGLRTRLDEVLGALDDGPVIERQKALLMTAEEILNRK